MIFLSDLFHFFFQCTAANLRQQMLRMQNEQRMCGRGRGWGLERGQEDVPDIQDIQDSSDDDDDIGHKNFPALRVRLPFYQSRPSRMRRWN